MHNFKIGDKARLKEGFSTTSQSWQHAINNAKSSNDVEFVITDIIYNEDQLRQYWKARSNLARYKSFYPLLTHLNKDGSKCVWPSSFCELVSDGTLKVGDKFILVRQPNTIHESWGDDDFYKKIINEKMQLVVDEIIFDFERFKEYDKAAAIMFEDGVRASLPMVIYDKNKHLPLSCVQKVVTSAPHKCNCDMVQILRYGCKCGGA